MSKQHKTTDEWREVLRSRLSPRLANQELFDLLWEDLPHIFAESAAQAKEIERLERDAKRWRAMFEHAAQLIADEIEAYGLAGDEATEEIEKWYAAILNKKASE